MADSTHYTRHYLKSVIGTMTKIMFASALMYGLLQLVKPFLHLPQDSTRVCGAWWDHLSDLILSHKRVVDVKGTYNF